LSLIPDLPTAEQITAPGLWAWRNAAAWRHIERVNVVCVGSSTTAGALASAVDRGWVARLGHRLRGGTTGVSYPASRDEGWSFTGTRSLVEAGLSLRSRRLAAGGTMTRVVTADAVTVWFKQGSGATPFTVTVDGTAYTVTPSTTGSTERYDGEWTSPPLPADRHTVTITGPATVMGLYAHLGDRDTGVRVINAGFGGTRSADYATATTALRTHNRAVARLAPALVVMMIGANDYATQVPVADYKTNVRLAVQRLRSGCERQPSVLLVHTYARPDVDDPAAPWSDYGDALRELAAELVDVDVVDLSRHYPTGAAADRHGLISDDQIHQTDRGHAWMAELVADHLAARLAAASAPTDPADPGGTDPATWPGVLSAWRSSTLVGADGDAVTWLPHAGTETSPLDAPLGRQAQLRTDALAGYPVVATSSTGRYLQTGPWSTTHTGPVTVLAVVQAGSTANTPNGNLWTGRAGTYCYAGITGDNLLHIGAGSLTAPAAGTVYCGHQRWQALGVVYDGADTALHTHDGAPVPLPLTNGSSYGLPGFTLGANSGAGANYVDALYADVIVIGRALSPDEMRSALAWLARRYHLDGNGRTTA
jgi:lysophospholipase L1-like esterase